MRAAGPYIVLLLLLLSSASLAQDIHFSQFFSSPLITNPAATGNFDGTYRFAGNQRRQWQSISATPFQTLGGTVDMNAPFGAKGLGAGLGIYHDVAGDSRYRTFIADLFLGGRFRLGPSRDLIVSVGGGFQFFNWTYDINRLSFNSQFNGIRYDPSLGHGETGPAMSGKVFSPMAGAMVEKRYSKRKAIALGFSGFNLTRPEMSSLGGSRLPLRRNLHLLSTFKIAEKWDLMPSGQWMAQGPHREFLVGSRVRYYLANSPTEFRTVQFGLFGRPGDAGYVFVGMERDLFYAGLSYDINLSSLNTATDFRGGWEVSLIYIIATVREKTRRLRQCPDYL